MECYIGLISGTSMDAVDAVLVNYSTMPGEIIETHSEPLPDDMKNDLYQLVSSQPITFSLLGKLDVQIGKLFANVAKKLIEKSKIDKHKIIAIGSHGQTVWHQPDSDIPFTIQIGDPNIIAEETGIDTVADFRRRDIAVGGQGAPFVPVFHEALFRSSEENRVVLNLGGIANISVLSKDFNTPVIGFDTGPANTLIDLWIRRHLKKSFDENGEWAASGTVNDKLLKAMLKDVYFDRKVPKSTGREYFHLEWVETFLHDFEGTLKPEDVQATLTELTAATVAKGIQQSGVTSGSLLVCGGGERNHFLMKRIQHHLPKFTTLATSNFGVPAEWMEALAFAWFAKNTINRQPINLTSVTGSRKPVILGGIYQS